MANLILVIIAIAVIIFTWLIWLRYILLHLLQESNHHLQVLKTDLLRRRDTVPYLLESYRKAEEPNETWHKILNARKQFNDPQPTEKEWEFEKELLHFLRDTHIKSLNFLEAKKDIIDLTDLIEKEKLALGAANQTFNEKKKQFPYSIASAIFGLREASI
jgi:hypothetical protein